MTKVKTQVAETKKFNELPFEFILYINNNIVCQRYFDIYDFNKDSLNSWEMKEMIDNISGVNNGQIGSMGIIPNYLKNKSKDYLWNNYNPYSVQLEQGSKNIFEKIDDFQFEVRMNKRTIAKSTFSGNFFQPKVRYSVDIKEIVPAIMSEIRYALSRKKYNKVVA